MGTQEKATSRQLMPFTYTNEKVTSTQDGIISFSSVIVFSWSLLRTLYDVVCFHIPNFCFVKVWFSKCIPQYTWKIFVCSLICTPKTMDLFAKEQLNMPPKNDCFISPVHRKISFSASIFKLWNIWTAAQVITWAVYWECTY